MFKQSSGQDTQKSALLSPPPCKGLRALDFVYQLNDRCLELLSNMASEKQADSPLALVHQHRALWQRLEPEARARAARLPFMLVDVHFTDAPWWREVREPGCPSEPETPTSFPKATAEPLITETLMLAWYVAQSEPSVAPLMVGMSRPVAEIIGALTTHQVHDIALRHPQSIRPRWAHVPDLWGALLIAAQRNDDHALAEIHAHAQLRFVGELLSGFH